MRCSPQLSCLPIRLDCLPDSIALLYASELHTSEGEFPPATPSSLSLDTDEARPDGAERHEAASCGTPMSILRSSFPGKQANIRPLFTGELCSLSPLSVSLSPVRDTNTFAGPVPSGSAGMPIGSATSPASLLPNPGVINKAAIVAGTAWCPAPREQTELATTPPWAMPGRFRLRDVKRAARDSSFFGNQRYQKPHGGAYG